MVEESIADSVDRTYPDKEREQVGPKDPESWCFLNGLLSRRDYYPPDSRLTRLLQEPLDFLGGGDEKTQVIVVRDDEPNGYALPGYIVVNDGLLKPTDRGSFIETEEELSGFEEHELTHIRERHMGERAQERSFLRRIGVARAQEQHADIDPLQRLDGMGINPVGILRLLEKFELPVADDERHDLEHGSPLDRRLNIYEVLRFADIRNLKDELTALSVPAEYFQEYYRDEDLWERLDILEPLVKRRFIQKQFYNVRLRLKSELNEDEKETATAQLARLIAAQRELVAEHLGGNTEVDVDDLTILSLMGAYKGLASYYENSEIFQAAGLDLNGWLEKFDSQEKIARFFALAKHPFFTDLGIDLSDGKWFIEMLGTNMVGAYFRSYEEFNQQKFMCLVDEIGEQYKLSDTFPMIPLLEHYVAADNFNSSGARSLGQLFEERNIHLSSLVVYLAQRLTAGESPYFFLPKGKLYDPTEISIEEAVDINSSLPPREMGFVRDLEDSLLWQRVMGMRQLRDPVALAQAMAEYEEEIMFFDEKITRIISDDESLFDYLTKELRSFEMPAMLQSLLEFQKKHPGPIAKNKFAYIIQAQYYLRWYEEGEKAVKSISEIRDEILLYSICSPPVHYLNQVGELLDCIDLSDFSVVNLNSLADWIIQAPQEARARGFELEEFNLSRRDLRKISGLLRVARDRYLVSAMQNKRGELSLELVSKFPVYNIRRRERDILEEEEESGMRLERLRGAPQAWQKLTEEALIEYREGRATTQQLETLFALGCASDNLQVLLQVPRRASGELVRKLGFREGLELVFEKYSHLPTHIFTEAVDYLIEEGARTREDFELLDRYVKDALSGFLADPELVGKIAVLDTFLVDRYRAFEGETRKVGAKVLEIKGLEPKRLLDCLLSTYEEDQPLREYLFERWWPRHRSEYLSDEIRRGFKIEDYLFMRNRPAKLEHWLQDIPRGGYKAFEELVKDVYLSTDALKYYALRTILTGRNGLLSDSESREELGNMFMGRYLERESSEGQSLTGALIHSFLAVGDQEELFLDIQPVLFDLILGYPPDVYPTIELAFSAAKNELYGYIANNHITDYSEEDIRRLEAYLGGDGEEESLDGKPAELLEEINILGYKIYGLMLGRVPTPEDLAEGQDKVIDALTRESADSATELVRQFAEIGRERRKKKYSSWELALLIGGKSGALGTRMLQLAGQHFEIPSDIREEYLQVFDSVKGQSRLQAYRTLRREAEYSPEIRDLLENEMGEIGVRIGGGSLVTVYEMFLKDGSKDVLAVRNPNILFFLDRRIDLLQKAFHEARKRKPEDKNIQLLSVLLEDVKQWVTDELEDPRFEEKDAQFREQNDTTRGKSRFSKGKSKYDIYVPDTKPTGTRWVRREEFIEGRNLAGLRIIEGEESDIMFGVDEGSRGKVSREDYQDIISVLVRNYVYQIFETGLVHSDIHPGNIRLTADNSRIVFLDRYNLLEITDGEREFFKRVIKGFSQEGVGRAVEELADSVLTLEENQGLELDVAGIKNKIIEKTGSAEDTEEALIQALVLLKQEGVRIPLNISLVLKNLQSLNMMIKDAGFDSFADAFKHTAGRKEMIVAATRLL